MGRTGRNNKKVNKKNKNCLVQRPGGQNTADLKSVVRQSLNAKKRPWDNPIVSNRRMVAWMPGVELLTKCV